MFAIKTFAGALLMPLPVALLLLLAGMVAMMLRWRRSGRVLFGTSGIVVFVAAFPPAADALMRPLEERYPAVLDASRLPVPPQYIVVLGSGYSPRNGVPVTAALESTAVVRLSEGLRLFRQTPGAQLIVSGGSVGGLPPSARGYELAAITLGVPPASIIVLDTPRDTAEEATELRKRVGDAPVLLVTSASHMPRAIAHCMRVGVHAIAAPTGNLTQRSGRINARSLFPSGTALRKTEMALHEYVGLLAMRLGIN